MFNIKKCDEFSIQFDESEVNKQAQIENPHSQNPNGHLPWTFATRDKIHWAEIPNDKITFNGLKDREKYLLD